MSEPDEEIIDDVELLDDEFDADSLDPNQLEDESVVELPEQLTGKVPVFLAKLQWWSFGILVAFILFIILRMIFGPPWIHRFRYSRPPVAIDQAVGKIGAIVPLSDSSYTLFFVDYKGHILTEKRLGKFQIGPVDIAMGDEFYYFFYGGGNWIAGRQYVPIDETLNQDIDLSQFNVRYRDGLDIIHSSTGMEYLNVFLDDTIMTLQVQGSLWNLIGQYKSTEWGEYDLHIADLSANHAIAWSGSAFMILDFPDFVDGYSKYNEATYLRFLQPRPTFQQEYYKPGWIIPARDFSSEFDYFILKNDRMYNQPYRYSDDQVLCKRIDKPELEPYRHPFFAGKDIRGLVLISSSFHDDDSPVGKAAQIAVLYETDSVFRLAGLGADNPKPYWDIKLGDSLVLK